MKNREDFKEIFTKGAIKSVVPFVDFGRVHKGLYEVCFIHKGKTFKFIWRPRVLERNISRAIPRKTYYLREVLFYQIASKLGIDDVPYTSIFKLNGYIGSIQKKVICGKKMTSEQVINFLQSYNKVRINQLALLDYICGNLDRHYGNVVVAKNKLWLVDNGLSFVAEHSHPRFLSPREQLIRRFFTSENLKKAQKNIKKKINNDEIDEILFLVSKKLGIKARNIFYSRMKKALDL